MRSRIGPWDPSLTVHVEPKPMPIIQCCQNFLCSTTGMTFLRHIFWRLLVHAHSLPQRLGPPIPMATIEGRVWGSPSFTETCIMRSGECPRMPGNGPPRQPIVVRDIVLDHAADGNDNDLAVVACRLPTTRNVTIERLGPTGDGRGEDGDTLFPRVIT